MKHFNQIKNTGFKTPENYFKNFEDNLLTEIEFNEKMKGSGFEIPDNYLETVEKNILKKTNESSKLVFLKQNYIYAISSIAATVLLLISLNVSDSNAPINIGIVDNETIEDYFYEEFESLELVSLIEDTDISESDFITYELSNQTIDSLIENDDELELYIN